MRNMVPLAFSDHFVDINEMVGEVRIAILHPQSSILVSNPLAFCYCVRLAPRGNYRYLTAMKVRLLVELDPETKRWSAVFPELPGCASAGDTEAEAIANAKEALELWFEPAPFKMNKGAKLMELAVP